MRILMLCPMISSSSFITPYPYAKVMSEEHDVVVVGPKFGKKPYIEDDSLKFEFVEPILQKPLQLGMLLSFFSNFLRLAKRDYDVVHAFKLLPNTAPAAALAKILFGKKFVLTVDDYDAAAPKNIVKALVLKIVEQFYKFADTVTVSSKGLQELYGGSIVQQVCDENRFDPRKHNGKKVRAKHGLVGKVVVLHAGTFYDFKGIDVLIKAVQELKDDRVRLLLVGEDKAPYEKIAGKETVFVGRVPLSEMPEYVAACDVYAVPTKDTEYARKEIPGKIFEPMAMGKAIVASRISDVPEFLKGGAGVLVAPDNVGELAEALRQLVNERGKRIALGKKARARYLKNYSYKQFREKATRVFEGLK